VYMLVPSVSVPQHVIYEFLSYTGLLEDLLGKSKRHNGNSGDGKMECVEGKWSVHFPCFVS